MEAVFEKKYICIGTFVEIVAYTAPSNGAILDKFSEHYQHQKSIKANAQSVFFFGANKVQIK